MMYFYKINFNYLLFYILKLNYLSNSSYLPIKFSFSSTISPIAPLLSLLKKVRMTFEANSSFSSNSTRNSRELFQITFFPCLPETTSTCFPLQRKVAYYHCKAKGECLPNLQNCLNFDSFRVFCWA